ncbi:MAG: hypothetical protein KDB82_02070 [Planctomycetes bacterium]|nr:hypothetical protein [Planctomycetota bacterium]
MKKAQRKAWLKELKRKEKLARQAGSDTAVAEDVLAAHSTTSTGSGQAADGSVAGDVSGAGGGSTTGTSPAAQCAESADVRSANTSGDSPQGGPRDPDETLRMVRDATAARMEEARAIERKARQAALEARELDDERAREMLLDAAALLHEIVTDTREALAHVPPERKREALAVINARPDPSDVNAQRRPRRGPDPVVSLMRIAMQAASLLRRIILKTNPELGQLKRAA